MNKDNLIALNNKEYALGTWEVHLQTKNERNFISYDMSDVCNYIDTAINYNNDYLLKSVIEDSRYKIISKIAPCHYPYYDFFVDNHFKCLNTKKIDIMLIHSNRGNWQDLAVRMEKDERFIHTGVSNFTLDEIEEYNKLIGHYPEYNEIEINPHYTDLKTIDFCKEHNIKIIAYGIFGGKYRAPTYIAKYSIPYLLSYVCKFADIVILKPECGRHVEELLDVIFNYKYHENDIMINDILDDKAVIPMTYTAPTIKKYAYSLLTYNNAVGKNLSDKIVISQPLMFAPEFEMLGDYMAYVRYTYRQDYFYNEDVYKYDILIGDNNKMYAVYLYDKDGNISKINETNNVTILEISFNEV